MRCGRAKQETLSVIYQVLCIHLGTPPSTFDWQWKDKDGEFHRDGATTPMQVRGEIRPGAF